MFKSVPSGEAILLQVSLGVFYLRNVIKSSSITEFKLCRGYFMTGVTNRV